MSYESMNQRQTLGYLSLLISDSQEYPAFHAYPTDAETGMIIYLSKDKNRGKDHKTKKPTSHKELREKLRKKREKRRKERMH